MLMTLKISDLMEENHRDSIGIIDYLKMVLFRFIRLAPLYYLVFLVGW